MQRRDFLKICFTALAGMFTFTWPKSLTPGLKEARFYRSADTLAG